MNTSTTSNFGVHVLRLEGPPLDHYGLQWNYPLCLGTLVEGVRKKRVWRGAGGLCTLRLPNGAGL